MKTVNVLLTKYSDWISCIVHYIGGGCYTHSSISLEEDAERFYSFNYNGFCVETPEKHKFRGVKKSLFYELWIPDESYEKIRLRIQDFEKNRKDYRYTRLGILFAALKISFYWKNHYICSQFVAELLKDTGAILLEKKTCSYLPSQFCKELEAYNGLKNIQYNVI